MIANTKYVTAKTIITMVNRTHKKKAAEFNDNDFIEWCAECETDYIGDTEGFVLFKAVECKVENLQALLPCHLHRLLDVCTDEDMSSARVKTYNTGVYINFDSDQSFGTNSTGDDVVYINYYGIPIDPDTGYPLIKKGHEQACEAFSIIKMYEEDYTNGRLGLQIRQDQQLILENCLMTAKGSFRDWTRGDLEEVSRIVGNIVNKIGYIPKFNIDK